MWQWHCGICEVGVFMCRLLMCMCYSFFLMCTYKHRYHIWYICHICISYITVMNRACIRLSAYLTSAICLQLYISVPHFYVRVCLYQCLLIDVFLSLHQLLFFKHINISNHRQPRTEGYAHKPHISMIMTSWNWQIFRVLALCAGNSTLTCEFLAQRLLRRSIGVLICSWTSHWLKKRDTIDFTGHCAHNDVTVMLTQCLYGYY